MGSGHTQFEKYRLIYNQCSDFSGGHVDIKNINFRAQEVVSKLGVDPIIMKFPLWNQRELHKENLDFDLDP